jgi:hypothetical protein
LSGSSSPSPRSASARSGASGVVVDGGPSPEFEPIPGRLYSVGQIRFNVERHESKVCVSRDYMRWIVACPLHPRCQKKRGCGANQTAMHGDLEPIAYLLAWCDAASGFAPGTHVAHTPSAHDVAAAMPRARTLA